MNRSMRDGGGRSRMGSGDYGSMRGYGGQGGGGYGGQGVLGSGPGMMGMGGGGYGGGGGGGGGYEMDSLIQQRTLQQQLSLRESQLALANSLLQQQSHLMDGPGPMGMRGGPGPMGLAPGMMNKRRQDMRFGDQPDFKRPRSDFRMQQPRGRYRGRDSDPGNRSITSRRTQSSSSSSSSRPYRSSERSASSGKARKEEYDPEKPTSDGEDEKKGGERGDKFFCHVCNISCRDDEGFRRHMNSNRHKDRMFGVLSIHEEKSSQIASRMKAEKHLRHLEDEERTARGFCKACDIAIHMRYADHQRLSFHKKRLLQVTKGCGWCGVSSFKNFSEVLAHRATEEHKKNQDEKEDKGSKARREAKTTPREPPIKVELPASLSKHDPETAVGQTCVISVTGWFCKLCNKFYNTESAAKETHCKTDTHFAKYKRFVYAKLLAKAQAEREEARKAAAEEKKKAAEERKKNGEEEEEEDGDEDEKEEGMEEEEGEEEEGGEDAGDDNLGEDGGEEEMKEGEEGDVDQDESDMLAADGSAMEYADSDGADGDGDDLLNELEDTSAYQTADDTRDLTAEASALSIGAEESGSQFLEDSTQGEESTADIKDEEANEEEGDDNDVDEETKPRATRGTIASSRGGATPRGRGRGGTNKARRGRKIAK